MFPSIGARLGRQFEFVQAEWVNSDTFVGSNDGAGTFTIPQRPTRRRIQGLPRFVVA